MFMDFLCILIFTERKKKSRQEYQIMFWHCSQKKKRNNPVKALQYSKARNKHTTTLINFWDFFKELRPYSGLHSTYLCSTLQMFAGIYGGFIGKSECGDFKFMGIACNPQSL